MAERGRGARAVGSRTALLVALAFLGFLIAGIIASAFGVTFRSALLTAVCIGPFLAGFLIATAYYLRTKQVSTRTLTVALDADSTRPGEIVSGSVVLHPVRPIRLRAVEGKIWGGEKTTVTVNYGKSSVTYTQEVAWADEPLELLPQGLAATTSLGRPEGGLLPPGEYLYRFEFRLPQNALPSWSGPNAKVFCLLRLRVVIERGFDAIQETDVRILPLRRQAERIPATFDVGKGLRLSLESQETVAGGTVVGKVEMAGLDAARVRDVRIRLIEQERAVARGHLAVSDKVLAETIQPVRSEGAQQFMFQLTVPPDARPSVVGTISSLQYAVQARANVALARDVTVEGPVRILPA